MFSNVLVICTGNICRSPIGEYLLRQRWHKPQVQVASAGVAALRNWPADDEAIRVMRARDIDITEHRARQLDAVLAQEADLILVMETAHQDWIHARLPTVRGRVHAMGKWIDLPEIADPYRRGPEAFDACAEQLERCVDSWVERLG